MKAGRLGDLDVFAEIPSIKMERIYTGENKKIDGFVLADEKMQCIILLGGRKSLFNCW